MQLLILKKLVLLPPFALHLISISYLVYYSLTPLLPGSPLPLYVLPAP